MTPHTLYSKYIPDGDFWLTEPNPFAGAIEYHPNGLTGEYFHAWKAATEALTDAEAIRAAQADQLEAQAQRIEKLEAAVELAIDWTKLDHPGGSYLENKLREAMQKAAHS